MQTLHVPSPDWREPIIYFVMTDRFADRFADGNTRNNDKGVVEFDPKSAVAREPGPFTVGLRGSGDPTQAPRVMDASAVITLP